VDIFARRGARVRSATPGIVASAGAVELGGNAVSVVGPGLSLHYYAHLDHFGAFKPGDRVRSGDVLGYVGDSGNAKGTPCHLHYGVYRMLVWPTDPWPLLEDGEGPRVRGGA
jgi:murein DD-endopeptidase MepM/ murein hydrolase activator NlpD